MYEYTYGGFTHKTLGVINILYASGEVVWRNSGFASEPGVYQYYVNICYYLSLKSRGFERRSIVYFFLILTTESSVGYIIMIFITFCNIKYLNKKLIVSGFLFMLPMIIYLGIWHYETKIANEIAFEGRIIPTINAINTILSNLLGIGSVKYTIVYDYLDIGSYDSYTQIGMRLGILGIAALILALWRVSKFSYTILGILTLSFLTNPFWFMPAIAMFYFSEKKYAQ